MATHLIDGQASSAAIDNTPESEGMDCPRPVAPWQNNPDGLQRVCPEFSPVWQVDPESAKVY